MKEIAISADELSAGYDKKAVISDVDFSVKPGEILTLIGPNGAGKSTILRAICGYISKISGKVEILGENSDNLRREFLAKKVSVLLTERLKPELMTCRDVVETGRYPYTGHFGILSEEDKTVVDDAIRTVMAEDFQYADFNSVSDGQRQRIILAKAICQQPEMLIMDEPTSFLDVKHKIIFFEILQKLVKERRIAVIISMHELSFARKVSDYVLCVKNGKIVNSGIPGDIFNEDNIESLYEIPMELYKKYLC